MRLEAKEDPEHGRMIDENMTAKLVEFWTGSANFARASWMATTIIGRIEKLDQQLRFE